MGIDKKLKDEISEYFTLSNHKNKTKTINRLAHIFGKRVAKSELNTMYDKWRIAFAKTENQKLKNSYLNEAQINLFKEMLHSSGLSPKELAQLIKINPASVCAYLLDGVRISLIVTKEFCMALRFDFHKFLELEDSSKLKRTRKKIGRKVLL